MPITPATLIKLRAIDLDPALVAAVGCAAGVVITTPSITRLLLMADGCVYGKETGKATFDLLIGEYHEILATLHVLMTTAGLSDEERQAVLDAFDAVIDRQAEPAIRLPRCPGRARFTET